MTEPKETSVTFTFKLSEDGRYVLDMKGDEPDTAQTYILWVKCMQVLLSSKELGADKKQLIRQVYDHVMSPAETLLTNQERVPLRIVTIYSNPQDKNQFAAVEFNARSGTSVRTGWVVYGTYKKVIEEMEKAFGPLAKLARSDEDPPTIVENWI